VAGWVAGGDTAGNAAGKADAMNLVLLGPPGVGKGTQGRLLAERLDVPWLSSGEVRP
jgi:replication-associated recombination protein RarA